MADHLPSTPTRFRTLLAATLLAAAAVTAIPQPAHAACAGPIIGGIVGGAVIGGGVLGIQAARKQGEAEKLAGLLVAAVLGVFGGALLGGVVGVGICVVTSVADNNQPGTLYAGEGSDFQLAYRTVFVGEPRYVFPHTLAAEPVYDIATVPFGSQAFSKPALLLVSSDR